MFYFQPKKNRIPMSIYSNVARNYRRSTRMRWYRGCCFQIQISGIEGVELNFALNQRCSSLLNVCFSYTMSEVRRRRAGPGKDKNRHASHANGSTKGHITELQSKEARDQWFSYASFFVGAAVALIVGVKYALYVRELHENDMWFSNIGVSSLFIIVLSI